jgi:hypothetical protein
MIRAPVWELESQGPVTRNASGPVPRLRAEAKNDPKLTLVVALFARQFEQDS